MVESQGIRENKYRNTPVKACKAVFSVFRVYGGMIDYT